MELEEKEETKFDNEGVEDWMIKDDYILYILDLYVEAKKMVFNIHAKAFHYLNPLFLQSINSNDYSRTHLLRSSRH